MNSTEINGIESTNNSKGNEEEKVVIDIEEDPNDTIKGTEINNGKELIETDKTLVDIQTEQKSDALKYGDNNPKSKEIWIQYYLDYGRSQNNDRRPHFREDYHAGAPLSYDPASRNSFIKFVFMILLIMLTITVGYNCLVLSNPVLRQFYIDFGTIILICCACVLVGLNYAMACSQCTRIPPFNYICLVISVLAMSNFASAFTVLYKSHIIFFSFLATAATVVVCILLACSKFDFTKWYLYVVGIFIAFSVIMLAVGVAMLVFNIKYKPLRIIMLFVAGIINVVVFIMELQMIIGGKAIEISEDDYALAAYLIYMSIVDIFLKFVQILGFFDE